MSKEKIYFDTNCIAYLRSPEAYSGNEDINWYNEKRIKKSLGYLSPIEYRKSLGITA